jgi:hypothetical protein
MLEIWVTVNGNANRGGKNATAAPKARGPEVRTPAENAVNTEDSARAGACSREFSAGRTAAARIVS